MALVEMKPSSTSKGQPSTDAKCGRDLYYFFPGGANFWIRHCAARSVLLTLWLTEAPLDSDYLSTVEPLVVDDWL